jgi:hypothetical protein
VDDLLLRPRNQARIIVGVPGIHLELIAEPSGSEVLQFEFLDLSALPISECAGVDPREVADVHEVVGESCRRGVPALNSAVNATKAWVGFLRDLRNGTPWLIEADPDEPVLLAEIDAPKVSRWGDGGSLLRARNPDAATPITESPTVIRA